jgi:hypothetical protein
MLQTYELHSLYNYNPKASTVKNTKTLLGKSQIL